MIMRNLEAAALSIGSINIQTGKGQYDWSIYDMAESTQMYLYNGNRLIYAAKNTFEVGDQVLLRGNDSRRKMNEGKITALLPCDREGMIEALLEHGFDYRVLRAFAKKRFKNKLQTSYSIKGVSLAK
jgi:hypothetical protein